MFTHPRQLITPLVCPGFRVCATLYLLLLVGDIGLIIVRYFRLTQKEVIIISAGTSSYGMCAVHMQNHGQERKTAAYASKSMPETEQRYVQLEKESLSVTWAYERFRDYVIEREFKIKIDNKPLVPLESTKALFELPPGIQAVKMRLMRYRFLICHI